MSTTDIFGGERERVKDDGKLGRGIVQIESQKAREKELEAGGTQKDIFPWKRKRSGEWEKGRNA